MKIRPCNLLTVALTTALMSPLAFGQSANGAVNATGQAQELPRPALPPAVNQAQPVVDDPRAAVPVETADPQQLEEPMTSPKAPPVQSQGAANAAGQSAVKQRSVWAELDADGDGRVSAAEGNIDADFTSEFSVIDSDGDGFVTDAEFRAHAKASQQDEDDDANNPNPLPPPGQAQGAANAATHSSVSQRDLWAELDTDSDGRISSVEGSVDAGFSANFAMVDADGDGFVSDVEHRAHAKAMHQDGTMPHPTTTGQGATHAAGHSTAAQGGVWAGLDANGDGRISAAEGNVDAGFSADFATTDTDHDGFVSDAEYRAHAKAMGKADASAIEDRDDARDEADAPARDADDAASDAADDRDDDADDARDDEGSGR